MPDALQSRIAELKADLDRLRPLRPDALANLRHVYDLELTYTSNAIEGNTLTLRETAELIDHGITVGGKPLRDHLEAEDHHRALLFMRDLADRVVSLGEATVTELHRRIVARSHPEIAGVYSGHARRVAGSAVVFPNPVKLPELMAAFGEGLAMAPATPEAAFERHFRLTAIHPFGDGNGRTARLLMNLMLIRAGYPPIAIRPEDRRDYLAALEHGSLTDDLAPFDQVMRECLAATLLDYLAAYRAARPNRGPDLPPAVDDTDQLY